MPLVLPGRAGMGHSQGFPTTLPQTTTLGHPTGAELLRWHLLEWGAGQESSVWCLEWGCSPHPPQGKGLVGSSWHSQARLSWPPLQWGQEGWAGACCTYCPARCPDGLRTFLQKKQEFLPFPCLTSPAGVHSWWCRAEAAEIPVSPSSAPNFTWWLLKPWHHCHHPAVPQGNVQVLFSHSPPVCLGWEPSRAHLSPVLGRAFLAGASLGKPWPPCPQKGDTR